MKRLVLTIAAAVILFSTFVIPAVVHADGPPDNPNCSGNTICRP